MQISHSGRWMSSILAISLCGIVLANSGAVAKTPTTDDRDAKATIAKTAKEKVAQANADAAEADWHLAEAEVAVAKEALLKAETADKPAAQAKVEAANKELDKAKKAAEAARSNAPKPTEKTEPETSVSQTLKDIQSQLAVQSRTLLRLNQDISSRLNYLPAKHKGAGNGLAPKNAPNMNKSKSPRVTLRAQPADGSTFNLPGEAKTYARRVHFLIYSYTDDPAIGSGVTANETFLKSYAESVQSFFSPAEHDRVYIKTSHSFSESSIAADIAAIPDVQPTDAIFCYMSTHGTYSSRDGHSVLMTDGNTIVPRSNLFKILKSRNARLTVFITDSCANFAAGAAGFPTSMTHPAATATYPLYRLLFKFIGDLNMNGASPDPTHVNADGSLGEEGFYVTNSSTRGGGIFTRAFVKEAIFGASQDWVQFFTNCQSGTLLEGQAVPTPAQTPAIFNENGVWVH